MVGKDVLSRLGKSLNQPIQNRPRTSSSFVAIAPPDKVKRFMTHLLRHQDRLYHYIRSLEPRHQDADDVLQEAYLVLWEKFDEYHEDTNFYAWACKIAYFKILQRRSQTERGPSLFAPELLQQLSDEAVLQADGLETQRKFLDGCLDKLPPSDLELITYRYAQSWTREKIAKLLGRSINSVSKALSRIRRDLWECISEEIKVRGTEWRVP
jgi:RNA polymerase sigma-70 factor, ECF subfamily